MSFRQPFSGEWPITQNYGEKLTSNFHTGLDYGCPIDTVILASGDGEVVFSGFDKTGYGNMVIIQHSSSKSTLYAHLSYICVKKGAWVKQGQTIGQSGNTGNSTGPHLHFEARTQWNNYMTHFDPFLLPMMSVYDSTKISPLKEKELIGPEALKKNVEIVAPYGAYGHSSDFSSRTLFSIGKKFSFTGKTTEHNGYIFCECVPVNDSTYWIAVNDGETQILGNIE